MKVKCFLKILLSLKFSHNFFKNRFTTFDYHHLHCVKSVGLIILLFYIVIFTIMKNEVNELQIYFCPFGYLDMKAVCEIGDGI